MDDQAKEINLRPEHEQERGDAIAVTTSTQQYRKHGNGIARAMKVGRTQKEMQCRQFVGRRSADASGRVCGQRRKGPQRDTHKIPDSSMRESFLKARGLQ